MNLGKWEGLRGTAFDVKGIPAVAGISGGRTSGLMAALLDKSVLLSFQNTSREHPKTYEFLARLQDALGREIVWLEWRPPQHKGDPPRTFSFEVVTYETASRDGSVFAECMRALADYRKTKGENPVAPFARMRICTAYLKVKVCQKWCDSLGIDARDQFVGLRADEPGRIVRLLSRETGRLTFRTPLAWCGIKKEDVAEFWSNQSFDLQVAEHQGNCTGCFLKDEGDIARAMLEEETDPEWWISMRDKYPDFGGRRFVGYRQLRTEGNLRVSVENQLGRGLQPTNDGSVDERRFRLVVAQERARLVGGRQQFSCACEQSYEIDDRL